MQVADGGGKQGADTGEARAAMALLIRHLFDVPGVVCRRRPLSDLAALPDISFLVGAIVLQTMLLNSWNDANSRLSKTIYLRHLPSFQRTLVSVAAVSLVHTIVSNGIKALVARVHVKWRARLTQVVHRQYVESRAYYYMQGKRSPVKDADQRITGDINSVSSTLVSLMFSSVSTIINAISAIWRLTWNPAAGPTYVFICAGFLYLQNCYQERVVPGIEVTITQVFVFCMYV